MIKTLRLALMFSVSVMAIAYATEEEQRRDSTGAYVLDEEKVTDHQLKEVLSQDVNSTTTSAQTENIRQEVQEKAPHILKEKTAEGTVEKLLDEHDKVIAEKVIKDGKIIKKILNYYYPNGKLMRQVTAKDGQKGFYAEEYYSNGKLSSQASYINESSKIGKEKRYDTNGTLRQEIPWALPDSEKNKPQEEQQTIREGLINTYYPTGELAATFPYAIDGTTKFFNRRGAKLKEITGGNILSFPKELTEADCQGASIKLGLEDLVELYEDEGDVSYNKCGMPYRENYLYEIVETTGSKSQKTSYDETGMIRKISLYQDGKKDGLEQKFDGMGNLTAEINYKDGVKDGYANGYFPTREVAFRKRYENGKVEGKLNCYFPTGEIAAEFNYKDGMKEGKAFVNSPVKKELEFSKDKLIGIPENKNDVRQLVSALANFTNKSEKCLNVDLRLKALEDSIKNTEESIRASFAVDIPEGCENFENFISKKGRLQCFDKNNKIRASIPLSYVPGEYAVEKVYAEDGKTIYEIQYKKRQKQGWTKAFDGKKVSAEIYYNQGKMAESSRSYYPNGRVKDIITIATDKPRSVLARYSVQGTLEFSLTYKDDKKQEAYISENNKNKDIVVRFYNGKPDSVRESNMENPYNFVEYNLALGEYAVYKDNELVRGGDLCDYGKDEKPVAVTETKTLETKNIETLPTIKETEDNVKNNTLSATPESVTTEPENLPEPPVMTMKEAPIVEDLEPVVIESKQPERVEEQPQQVKDYKVENAIIPTEEEKRQAKLAAQNIGPIAKPDIEQLADVVQKKKVETTKEPAVKNDEVKTDKFYYPNGNLRKTVKTRGLRTEEVKEYSKNGLLLTDIMYNKDKIVIEKYFGTGKVRRKTKKAYDDNAVTAFISRSDFYDNGKKRYDIEREPNKLLFSEKTYYPDGKIKSETKQNSVLSFTAKEYDDKGNLKKETTEEGINILVKEYDANQEPLSVTMNGKAIPLNLAVNSADLLKDNARMYDNKGKISALYQKQKDKDVISEYYRNGKLKTEIVFYHNGEISVKLYNMEGTLLKFAYLAPDGKLHIEKPELRTIPSYRERYWVDYNNPRWIENQDKYSVRSIARLNLDVAAYILAELEADVPEMMKLLYERY